MDDDYEQHEFGKDEVASLADLGISCEFITLRERWRMTARLFGEGDPVTLLAFAAVAAAAPSDWVEQMRRQFASMFHPTVRSDGRIALDLDEVATVMQCPSASAGLVAESVAVVGVALGLWGPAPNSASLH